MKANDLPQTDPAPTTPVPADAVRAEAPAPAEEAASTPRAAGSPEPSPWLPLGVGVVMVGGLGLVRALQRRGNEEVQRILDAYRAPALPEPLPPRPPEPPPPVLSRGVTERPARVTFDWCWRFCHRTAHEVRARLVPSRSSRSQYLRIATRILQPWGHELDARGTTFERLRWIAQPQLPSERHARYLHQSRLPNERPTELKKTPRMPELPRRLLRPRPVVRMGTGETMACDPGPVFDCRSPTAAPCCGRPSRRRWEPRTPSVCGEGIPVDSPDFDAMEKQIREILGQDIRLPRPREVPRPDRTGSCLPHPPPCPRRRRQPEPVSEDLPPVKKLGRQRVAGDHDWW